MIDPLTFLDFDAIARQLVDTPAPDRKSAIAAIAAALHATWNARGAADIGAIDASLSSMMGPTAAGPYVKNLTRTIKQLDATTGGT